MREAQAHHCRTCFPFSLAGWMSCFLMILLGSFARVTALVSTRPLHYTLNQRQRLVHRRQASLSVALYSSSKEDAKPDLVSALMKKPSSASSPWAKHALLISSFTDGILASPEAQSFLKHSLAGVLLSERIRNAELQVQESVRASPCNGPNMEAFNSLEAYDKQLQQHSTSKTTYDDASANQLLKSLRESNSQKAQVRLLYIPTAMYALNPNSSNTPGKQRQRARADGKKRRNQVVQHVEELLRPHLPDTNVLAITLDLDDGSLKQPTGSETVTDFPTTGEDALTKWAPNIVYVEGGNTFWLQHCLEKGNWAPFLRSACTGPDATAVYIGKSAGAIIAGATMETATWKGWDDPSVVPSRETYADWMGHPGLDMVGSQSFFPHMSDEWETTVALKRQDVEPKELAERIICLREWDACCVDGNTQQMTVVSGVEATVSQ